MALAMHTCSRLNYSNLECFNAIVNAIKFEAFSYYFHIIEDIYSKMSSYLELESTL